ncbi:hypothetical protein ARMGADRAFT_1022902 [Armillaria gallica]|uniref:CCHC-type domain-containing protein n=1 Tax=Armillaria gallica TaxID=47427 RepID=A0A2H3EES4_ARMGA|nr:hypothetical protein ARMGADRAFT_1022902 [Armillaria gallica]
MDDEKKDWAVHYTDTDIKDQWRAFPTFKSGKTWKEFKDKVMHSYDGTAEDDEDTCKGLLKVAHKYKREGIMDSANYLNYRQEFQAKSKQVIKESLMSNLDLVRLFISPFETEVSWKCMKDCLSSQLVAAATVTNLVRNTCDPWVLEDVFDAGTWVLKGPGAVYNKVFDSALPVAASTTKAEALSMPLNRGIITYKKEPAKAELPKEMNSLLAMMANSNRLIVKLLETTVSSQSKRDEELHKMLIQIKTQPRITQSVPIQSTRWQYGSNAPGNCHFCETPGHFQVDCPYKLEIITTGELVHVPDLYCGLIIIRPGASTLHMAPEKVDQYLEGPQWESVVKTRGQQWQEDSQANEPLQNTQDFHKYSMKAGEHYKKAAVVTRLGEVRKELAYRKKVEVPSGNLEKEVWDQMMNAPITLTAEDWLALSPGARQKMKTYVMPKRILISKVLLENVTDAKDDEKLEELRVPLGSVANILEPGLENYIRIEDLPVECSFYVTTM